METLYTETQGIKGGKTKGQHVGYAFISYGRTKFYVDNFTGYGETYKQREEPEIFIEYEGKTIFKGTAAELNEELNQTK